MNLVGATNDACIEHLDEGRPGQRGCGASDCRRARRGGGSWGCPKGGGGGSQVSTMRSSTRSDRDRGGITGGARVPCPAEAARVWAWPVRRRCGELFSREEEGGGLVSFQRLPLPGGTTKTFLFVCFVFFAFFSLVTFLKCRAYQICKSAVLSWKKYRNNSIIRKLHKKTPFSSCLRTWKNTASGQT